MMPIREFNKGSQKCYEYSPPSDGYFVLRVRSLLSRMRKYANIVKQDLDKEIQVDILSLGRVVARVEQRKEYFLIFHRQTKLSEIKEAALLAYWLVKYHPFRLACDDKVRRETYCNINETFAASLLIAAIQGEVYRRCHKRVSYPREGWQKLLRALTEWDISKEALILASETACETLCLKK